MLSIFLLFQRIGHSIKSKWNEKGYHSTLEEKARQSGMRRVIIPLQGKIQAKVERKEAIHSTSQVKASQSGKKRAFSFHFKEKGKPKWNEKGYHSTSKKKLS